MGWRGSEVTYTRIYCLLRIPTTTTHTHTIAEEHSTVNRTKKREREGGKKEEEGGKRERGRRHFFFSLTLLPI